MGLSRRHSGLWSVSGLGRVRKIALNWRVLVRVARARGRFYLTDALDGALKNDVFGSTHLQSGGNDYVSLPVARG